LDLMTSVSSLISGIYKNSTAMVQVVVNI
jgi:hypothetical protein